MRFFTQLGKKALIIALFSIGTISAYAQEQKWSFDAAETADYAAFLKQPSMVDGKCNAEILGIDVKRDGFSWDDMNTWLNAEGKIWKSYSSSFSETLFGVCVNKSAGYDGKTSSLSWTNNQGDNKWYPAIAAVVNLKGNLELSDCRASTVNISGTKIETIKIKMNNDKTDCYLNVRRNPVLTSIDISGSTGKCREFAGYTNAFSDENSIIAQNCPKVNFLDWLVNLENNHYTFSSLPPHPITGAVLTKGYKGQWPNGYPIGTLNSNGKYEVEVDEDVDLSSEYEVNGKITQYTWKDEDGEVFTLPSFTADGWFSFDESCIGKTYRCEMTNSSYPDLTLITTWITVKAVGGVNSVNQDVNVKMGPNPVDNTLYVQANNLKNISVFSVSGNCVADISGNTNTVDMSGLSSGVYLVKVTTDNGIFTSKVMKK